MSRHFFICITERRIMDSEITQRLIPAFGGDDNIEHVEACITRLRVTVKDLNKVDTQALQQEGALGVIIIGQQVHAIFGRQSDTLRQLLDAHFSH
ncbi:PTS sugar transporter [Enterobacter ludwigii]|nr:PTS sugar transporter [Enterobacter ludwigii]KZP56527.1 PTS sugar transporter [Enterobacter ludwigii]MBB2844785.1 PTS system glucose-specific IIB component [Enterobacter ludwigii]